MRRTALSSLHFTTRRSNYEESGVVLVQTPEQLEADADRHDAAALEAEENSLYEPAYKPETLRRMARELRTKALELRTAYLASDDTKAGGGP